MNKINFAVPIAWSDKIKEEEDDLIPMKFMTEKEATEIRIIMDYQEEMFLGGLNDELMDTTLGIYEEPRKQFEKVKKEWENLYGMIDTQVAEEVS